MGFSAIDHFGVPPFVETPISWNISQSTINLDQRELTIYFGGTAILGKLRLCCVPLMSQIPIG